MPNLGNADDIKVMLTTSIGEDDINNNDELINPIKGFEVIGIGAYRVAFRRGDWVYKKEYTGEDCTIREFNNFLKFRRKIFKTASFKWSLVPCQQYGDDLIVMPFIAGRFAWELEMPALNVEIRQAERHFGVFDLGYGSNVLFDGDQAHIIDYSH